MKQYQIVKEMLDGSCIETNKFISYNEAMEKYKEIKKSNLDGVHIVKFNKIEDGVTTNRFTKKVQEKKMFMSCRDIVKNVDELMEMLENLKTHHEATIKIAERKRETLLHLIRAVGKKDYQDKNEENLIKLNLFDEISLWENKRKDAKVELEDIYNMQKSASNLNLDSLLKPRGKVKLNTESVSVTRNKYERVVTYKDNKEKEMYLKQNKNYAYYILDDLLNTIYFYNRFDNQKSKKEFKKALQNNNVVKLAVKDIDNNIDENVQENKKTEEEIKVLQYKTIKERGHFERQFKSKYNFYKADPASQKLYFSNQPIDLSILV